MRVSFNLNDEVLVKITPVGEKLWREHYEFLRQHNIEPPAIERDDEGRTRIQLWVAMRIFGPAMANGAPNPLDMMAEFVGKDGR
jgi:hypothetical protein